MKDNKKQKDMLNKVLTNPLVIIICDIATIGGFLCGVWSQNIILKYIIFTFFAIVLAFTIVYIIFRWFSIRRAIKNIQKLYIAKSQKLGDFVHLFFHDLRDCNNYLDINESITDETFKDKAKILCNYIECFFTYILETENKVCVCIKLLDTNSISDSDYKKWKTYTFARSASTDTSRYKNDEKRVLITENTDFELIVSDEKIFSGYSYFYSEDLEKTKKDFEEKYNMTFKNSNLGADYKSTIVVPIRISSKLASPKLEIDTNLYTDHILGFLCIDSDETFSNQLHNFKYSIFKMSIKYACAFADSLYHFFESYLIKKIFKDNILDANKNDKSNKSGEK